MTSSEGIGILASEDDPKVICRMLLEVVEEMREERPNEIPTQSWLIEQFMLPGRYDSPEERFVKRVCDTALPRGVREGLVQRLFEMTIGEDEMAVVEKMYMNGSQLRLMAQGGMTIGSHGHSHVSLEESDEQSQAAEIDVSLEMLREVYGNLPARWTISYPYGFYNARTSQLLTGC